MTKFDIEIEEFRKAFPDKKKKIAIYGTGRLTVTLLEYIKDYNFIGLLDRDDKLIGSSLYGLKVLSRDEVEKQADFIVINTQESYWNSIFERIKDWDIPVYYKNGERAHALVDDSFEENPYWKTSLKELEDLIEKNDIISFDIFDTLLMRFFFLEFDVFKLIETKIKTELKIDFNFVETRKKVLTRLNEPSINDIYTEMQRLCNLSGEQLETIKQLEIKTDLSLIVPRKELVLLCKKIQKKKNVFFISDMYYPKEIMQQFLKKVGIKTDLKHIIVSCDIKITKASGDLWNFYKEEICQSKKALHIGDNKKADCFLAEKNGIDSFYIMNAKTMLENSSLRTIVPNINSLFASLNAGLLLSRIFNSPFALNKTRGRIVFNTPQDAGYCLFGGVLYSFILWLTNICSNRNFEKLLFFGRDGYFFIRLYNYFCSKVKGSYKKADYLEISRRTVMCASIRNEKDIREVVKFPYSGNLSVFLKKRFGINTFSKDIILDDFIEIYKDKIQKRSEYERRNYIKYLRTIVKPNKEFAVVDSWFYGNNQYYLGKMLDKRINGFYMCCNTQEQNQCFQHQNMEGCFSPDCFLLKNALFCEAFFTSPKGMLLYIDSFGIKHYEPKRKNQKFFYVRKMMIKGVFEFFKNIISLQKNINLDNFLQEKEFADKLFGAFMNISEDCLPKIIKDSFFYDNDLLGKAEVKIFN